MHFTPIITYLIIGITCLVSFAAFNDRSLMSKFIFNPYAINHYKQWYRFFTHALLHADYAHLLFNMITLFCFGPIVEHVFVGTFGMLKGDFFFVLLYVGGIMVSSVYSFEKHKENSYYNALGASGATSSILLASIIINPLGGVILMFFPIPIPGFIFGIVYLAGSSYMAKRGGDNIGHDAHFWGAVYGAVFTVAIHFQFLGEFMDQIRYYFQNL